MSEIQHANPFGFDPIPAYEFFTGRSKVIDEIERWLNLCNINNKINLLIVGPSGSGKTSLLNYIKLKMERENIKLLFVELDLMQSKFKKDVTLFKQILDEISYKLNIKPSICNKEFFDSDFINMSASRLRNCFNILAQEAENQGYTSIILVIEDTEFLRNTNLLSIIKLIFSRLNRYNLVFLGIENTKGLLRPFSPVPIELNYFENMDEVKACIVAKLKDHEKNLIDDNVYDEIFQLTKGCPRLVMLFAHYLYRKHFEETKYDCSINSLDSEILEKILLLLDTQNIDPKFCDEVKNILKNKIKKIKPVEKLKRESATAGGAKMIYDQMKEENY